MVHKFNVRNIVSKLEFPCERMSDPYSENCFGETFLLAKENAKIQLRITQEEVNLSHPMKISIESPQTLSEEELEQIVDVWNRKTRRRGIVVEY